MLSAIPWYALPISVNELLIDRFTVTESPLWSHNKKLREFVNPGILSIGVNSINNLPSLSDAEDEAENIFNMCPSDHKLLLTKEKATLGDNPELLLSNYQIIHIASHTTVHQGLSNNSTIRLTTSKGNTPITISSISKMSLNADLVYLSSCESARVISSNGTMTSFTSAFLEAGVNNVIASPTAIDDQFGKQTAELFYKFWLGGATKPEALRQALLIQRKSDTWSGPEYWGFIKIYGQID